VARLAQSHAGNNSACLLTNSTAFSVKISSFTPLPMNEVRCTRVCVAVGCGCGCGFAACL
jgi:hypothetical protein